MKLYYASHTCALASHIALEQSGAPYEVHKVDFAANEQKSPAYLQVNPKGRVPALLTPQGVLTETPAILLYIAQCFPQARLAPLDDPFALAQLQSFNSYLCSTVHPAHAHGRRASRWADEPEAQQAMQRKMPQNMADCFELIERHCFRGPWVMGADYGIGDMYLFTIARWLEMDQVDIRRFPQVASHRERMLAEPAVQRVLALH